MPTHSEVIERLCAERDALQARLDAALARGRQDRVGAVDATVDASRHMLTLSYLLAFDDRAVLAGEVDRLHSWDGLMALLDEHWPADIFPTLPDDESRDPGPRIVSLLRWVERLRATPPSGAGQAAADEGAGG